MYTNIEKKIKTLAIIVLVLGIFYTVISVMIYVSNVGFDVNALLTLFKGIFGSIAVSWLIYGFGELIEKATAIASNTGRITTPDEDYISRLGDIGSVHSNRKDYSGNDDPAIR